MNKITQYLRSMKATIQKVVVLTSALACTGVSAGTVALNTPIVLGDPVIVGQTSSEVVLPISASDSMRLQVIAPVEGVTLTLLDPTGISVLAPADPSVSFLDGNLITPPRPGGVFMTPTIDSPADGDWTVRLDYPSAIEKTVIIATLYTNSEYQTGLILDRSEYRVGQTAALGMIALQNGQPITGLSPSITIEPAAGPSSTFTGIDDGDFSNFDGLADDGIYSGGYTFTTTGTHTISSVVTIPTDSGSTIQKTASATVNVTSPIVELIDIDGSIVLGEGSCVAGLNVDVMAETLQPAFFVASAHLVGSNTNTIEANANVDMVAPGVFELSLFFSSDDIRNEIGVDGPYAVSPVDILADVSLEAREADAYTFSSIALDDLCISPIAITQNLDVNQTLRDGHIESLQLGFPVAVSRSGYYQLTFKVTGASGQDVELFGLNQYMSAGTNTVEVSLPYEKFQAIDGPYSLESALILGQGESAQVSVVGSTDSLSRWQFVPRIKGDLDADGDVDVADRNILLGYRNQPVLAPGDRRDLTGDGRIDLRDVRYITQIACQAGACPLN